MESRQAFEDWIIKNSRRAGTHIKRDYNGKYLDNRVDSKWTAWLACQEYYKSKEKE